MRTVLEERIIQKALSFKFDDSDKIVDSLLESQEHPEFKKKFKNVCAMLSEPLVNRFENTLGILGMSKREFIEMAIIEALDKADKIMDEFGIDDYIESFVINQKNNEKK